MLTIFRNHTFLQLLALLALLIGSRLFFITSGIPVLTEELEWILAGKKINDGMTLYTELFTRIEPLSALTYQFIDNFFGNSPLIYEISAAIILFIQILLFNFLVNKRNLLNEKTYIPGLIYLVLATASFAFMKLSPALMANTFVILGINSILSQIEKREGVGEEVFEAGIYFGLSTLFYLPSFLFLIWGILVLILYTNVGFRQVFLVVLSFFVPIFFMTIIFYVQGNLNAFIELWTSNIPIIKSLKLHSVKDILLTITLPVILSILGIYRVFTRGRYNSFQNRSHQALLIFGIFAILVFLLSESIVPYNLTFFIIPLAFYISGFFMHDKKILFPELLFLILGIIIFSISFIGLDNFMGLPTQQLSEFRAKNTSDVYKYKGQKIFITGGDLNIYMNNDMATGYLNWNLAKADFENPHNYLSISNISKNLSKDLPDIIIDEAEVMPQILNNLPLIKEKYNKKGKNIYEIKSKKID